MEERRKNAQQSSMEKKMINYENSLEYVKKPANKGKLAYEVLRFTNKKKIKEKRKMIVEKNNLNEDLSESQPNENLDNDEKDNDSVLEPIIDFEPIDFETQKEKSLNLEIDEENPVDEKTIQKDSSYNTNKEKIFEEVEVNSRNLNLEKENSSNSERTKSPDTKSEKSSDDERSEFSKFEKSASPESSELLPSPSTDNSNSFVETLTDKSNSSNSKDEIPNKIPIPKKKYSEPTVHRRSFSFTDQPHSSLNTSTTITVKKKVSNLNRKNNPEKTESTPEPQLSDDDRLHIEATLTLNECAMFLVLVFFKVIFL
jgi:hypothetical protein